MFGGEDLRHLLFRESPFTESIAPALLLAVRFWQVCRALVHYSERGNTRLPRPHCPERRKFCEASMLLSSHPAFGSSFPMFPAGLCSGENTILSRLHPQHSTRAILNFIDLGTQSVHPMGAHVCPVASSPRLTQTSRLRAGLPRASPDCLLPGFHSQVFYWTHLSRLTRQFKNLSPDIAQPRMVRVRLVGLRLDCDLPNFASHNHHHPVPYAC